LTNVIQQRHARPSVIQSKLSGVFAGPSSLAFLLVIRMSRIRQQYDLTWTGRGKRPRWVMAWLAEGGRMEELGVQ